MVPEELAQSIHTHLGGRRAYAAYADTVWSTNGAIAILIFARSGDVASGVFEILGGLVTKVNLGARCVCACVCLYCLSRRRLP